MWTRHKSAIPGVTDAIKVDIDNVNDDGGSGAREADNVLVGTEEVIGGSGNYSHHWR